jgi:hypothetical protein
MTARKLPLDVRESPMPSRRSFKLLVPAFVPLNPAFRL